MDKTKYNILYLVSTLRDCGPVNQLYGLIKNLDRETFNPHMLTLSPEPSNSKLGDFKELGLEIKSLDLSRLEMIFKGKARLRQIVKEINPDLIHTSGIRPDSLVEKNLREYLQISTIRNYPYDDYPVKFGRIIGRYMARKHLAVLNRVSYPVCCSYAIAKRLKTESGLETDVVQNGIEADKYRPVDSSQKEDLRKKLGLSSVKLIFVTAGSLISRKDPINLIKGFNKADMDNAILIILGDGPLMSQCKEHAKGKNIYLKGHISNVGEYYQAADVFVSASKSEGLPNAVMEAMGAGLPVLLSDIEPHQEIISKSSGFGKVFLTGDAADLSKCLKNFLKYDLIDMGNNARNILEDFFTAGIMSKSYQRLYSEILE